MAHFYFIDFNVLVNCYAGLNGHRWPEKEVILEALNQSLPNLGDFIVINSFTNRENNYTIDPHDGWVIIVNKFNEPVERIYFYNKGKIRKETSEFNRDIYEEVRRRFYDKYLQWRE